MHDAFLVRPLQRVGDLQRDRERLFDRHRAAEQPLGECLPFDELHDQEMLRARLALFHYVAIGMNNVGARVNVSATVSRRSLYLRIPCRNNVLHRRDFS